MAGQLVPYWPESRSHDAMNMCDSIKSSPQACTCATPWACQHQRQAVKQEFSALRRMSSSINYDCKRPSPIRRALRGVVEWRGV
ncbi:hypothetical protein L13192_01722 [Pyrenophora tritici-repentis]|uniref:Uncharacterized protein n=2 Tax=Pyrenophora tritici-repentis TaxID=45151 RepID=A0A922NSM7_9PLEO|nr:uncharacterized protein PTRG_00766 [Pyrenophora tritici-repentis Pt-1C-BFP]EDU40204.1 predicted protein [Pyrenophora tritici-repentis Pt-1C-BFP]KAI1520666.1 hypothetical protein Ptr86124_001034 [Pyrenophora tritici-repentis]KAI1674975.1 hypothetical protein L13192_01722 [Pyrenophora tritici-repentis]KAI1687889.1 hypothetical protein KJE20_01066 [Pyrenophora tritici-repentis]